VGAIFGELGGWFGDGIWGVPSWLGRPDFAQRWSTQAWVDHFWSI
jgi:hypothetical protein